MESATDDFIVGTVKGKLGELLDRLSRERPELSASERDDAVIRLASFDIAEVFAARPDLGKRFSEMAAEHFLRSVAQDVKRLRSA
jgi:hypothetical protein